MTARSLFTAAALALVSAATLAAPAPATDPAESRWLTEAQEKLQATYQNLQFDQIAPSDIPGLIEIYTGGKILYYHPEQELLVIGEVYAANGVSLTEQKVSVFAARKAGSIDRSLALTVGNGPREVIAFVDPDCTYCRQADAWFQAQEFPDIKELIYFMPVKGRAQAEARALEAVCAPETERRAALTRAFDTTLRLDLSQSLRCQEGLDLLTKHADTARAVGVYATPFFIIDGEVIAGFDKARLTELLGRPASAARASSASP
jgi:thiol:disulfide interchange protein DsbC